MSVEQNITAPVIIGQLSDPRVLAKMREIAHRPETADKLLAILEGPGNDSSETPNAK